MLYSARRREQATSRRPPTRRSWRVEVLEARAVLSALFAQVPTETLIKASSTIAETAQALTFTATVLNENTNTPVNAGHVRFVLESPTPLVLGTVKIQRNEASITTSKLVRLGVNSVEADFIPPGPRLAQSASAELKVNITPLTVTSFLVTPEFVRGHPGEPMSFAVTARLADGQPDLDYTGTVVLTSPTDSNTVFPPQAYVRLGISAPSPLSTGLATFNPKVYTFTPADHGTHVFVGGVTFGKGAAEMIKVTQANNRKIHGEATFAIS